FRYNFAGYLARGDLPSAPKIVQQTTAVPTRTALPHPTPPPPPPRRPINVTRIAPPELRGNPDVLVPRFVTRVFQRQLPRRQLDIFKQFLVSCKPDTSDRTILALLHLMMSTPEFQLT